VRLLLLLYPSNHLAGLVLLIDAGTAVRSDRSEESAASDERLRVSVMLGAVRLALVWKLP
jgi:hypothetical protein